MDCSKLSPVTSCCVTVRNENEIGVQKNTDRRDLELIESVECAQSIASPYIVSVNFINIKIGHTSFMMNCIKLSDLGGFNMGM